MAMHVVVATYNDMLGARDAIAAVKEANIKLVDQAYVLNNGDGNLEFKEGKDGRRRQGLRLRRLDGGGRRPAARPGRMGGRRGRRPRGWPHLQGTRCGDSSADIERLGQSLAPGHAAAIAVTHEGDEDRVREIFHNYGGEVVTVGVTDDVRTALEGTAPDGVTVAADGSSTGTA